MLKTLIALTALALSSAILPLSAAELQERDLIEIIRSQVASNREALVAENLGLTAEESDAFWPVYRRFQNQRSGLVDRRIALLTEFRDNFETLGDAQARQILDDSLKLQDDFLKLRRKFVREFRKVLPEKKVLRYLQIEGKIDTIIDYDLAQVVPLAE